MFENAPPNVSVGQEPAAWEGSLIGIYADPAISVQHMALDGLLSGVVYSEVSTFAEAALTKALQNSGLAAKLPGPLKIAGIAIGVGAAYGSLVLMERDHPKNDNKTFIDKDGVRHMPRAMAPDDDNTSFTGPAGGAVMQMVA
ncbi:hypothetical protein EJB06_06590 [Massilia atriviolacea]|uniref:Uncharacterized protein n=1 Tax=Massilia atriviolacea TaxID=2495579 RepID=A0A430HQP8_9BURK|nr:hypothetical protein EJB06_06590 [Massilia atriviolacea]